MSGLNVIRRLTSIIRRIKNSRATIPVFKGSLAYVLFFVLFFLKPFQNILSIPSAGSSAVLVTILGFPGRSVDACLHSLLLGMLGAGIGGLNFLVLGKLAPYPVAQAAVFFLMVYVPALIKMRNPSYLVFSLYCISMSWNGVYSSSSSSNRQYSPELLASFLQTYAWGAAIVVFVNVVILPHSSEAELRTTLVHCIDHLRTLAFLIKKTYWCEITDEESKVRDDLVQSIRADCHFLQGKLERTFLGITYSKWSGDEYKKMVQLTKSMQQSLISTHSNLSTMEQPEARPFIDQVIATGSVDPELLRKCIYVGLTEIQRELALGSESAPFMRQEMELLREIDTDIRSNKRARALLRPSLANFIERNGSGSNADNQQAASQLRDIQSNIAFEISRGVQDTNVDVIESPTLNSSIRQLWTDLQTLQNGLIGQLFKSGKVYHPQEPLLIDSVASPTDLHFPSGLPCGNQGEPLTASNSTERHRLSALQPVLPIVGDTSSDGSPNFSVLTAVSENTPDRQQQELTKDELHRSLLRTFSHSCIMGMFLEELIELRELVLGLQSDGYTRRMKFHINVLTDIQARIWFRKQPKPEIETSVPCHDCADETMTMQEALETLKGERQVPYKKCLLEQALRIEKFARSPDSICAAKVACAVSTLGIMYWSNSTREFAKTYNLNTAILPLVVAITPTLGQSWLGFILQISGAAIGLLYSMVVLEVFRNSGGYKYNPYGIISAMALFSVPMNYLLYTKPKLLVLSALGLNSAGTLIYPMYLNQKKTFDSPPHRMGKSLTSLAVALGIVTFLQLFSRVEPSLGKPFNAVEYVKIARANQLILDRNPGALPGPSLVKHKDFVLPLHIYTSIKVSITSDCHLNRKPGIWAENLSQCFSSGLPTGGFIRGFTVGEKQRMDPVL
ncbi:hypothetical protein PtB15_9B250 [Puccinia triticina]|nr:hypothetical protein PtB15_9B250 [Puccinia triticina]